MKPVSDLFLTRLDLYINAEVHLLTCVLCGYALASTCQDHVIRVWTLDLIQQTR
jgi:hypothetical protein